MIRIVTIESLTAPGEDARGAVLVAGSHGGRIAGWYGARAAAHALILNDAGVGMDRAGIAALPMLDAIGMAAATVSHASARIGDGADMLARGIISHANLHAARVGVAAGQSCAEAAGRLVRATPAHAALSEQAEGRLLLASGPLAVLGLDSIGMLRPEDAGRILVIGSHGALHGGRPETALGVAARAAVFNDAGIGADRIGITRLPALDARAIPGATVDCMSARIGDCRSMWAGGVISHLNRTASDRGARVGESVAAFAARFFA